MATSKKKKRKNRITFSKKMVTVIMAFAIFDIQLSYILAFFDKQIAETLSVAIVTEIIGVASGYFIKSFRENREEANMKLERDREGLKEEEDELVN